MIGMCIYASDSLLEMKMPWMVGSISVGDPSEQKGRAGRRALKTGGTRPWGRAGAEVPCAGWAMLPPTLGAEPLAEGLGSGLLGSGYVVGP